MEAPPSHRPLLAIRRLIPRGGLQRDALRTASARARREHEVTPIARRAEVDVPVGATLDPVPITGRSDGALAHAHREPHGQHRTIAAHLQKVASA